MTSQDQPPIGNFNYPIPYRLGWGRITELAAALGEVGIARPLVVTDPGIVELSWFPRVLDALGDVPRAVFSRVDANPTAGNVEEGVAAYRAGEHDGLVLIGGGSAIDVGKCIALMARNAGTVFDYEDVGDNWRRADASAIPPMIAVPTTAGTGSEVGRASVIVDVRDHAKRIIFHPRMQPRLVIADPELTAGLPPHVTAATGMDALAHSFEAFCAPGYHPMADGIALEGMRLVHENLRRVFVDGSDRTARTHMLMAASMGATAFQKGLGLVHALSHPLGGATNIHHGLANAIFMPYVMVFNRAEIEHKMVTLSRHLSLPDAGFDAALDWVLALRRDLELPHTLAAAPGFDEAMAEKLVPLAAADPSLATNPRPCTADDLLRVFLKALEGDLTP